MLPEQDLQDLLNNPTELATVLQRHVVPGTVFAAGLKGSQLITLNGEDITQRIRAKRSPGRGRGMRQDMDNNGNPMELSSSRSGKCAHVVSADNIATNGVVHFINMVL